MEYIKAHPYKVFCLGGHRRRDHRTLRRLEWRLAHAQHR